MKTIFIVAFFFLAAGIRAQQVRSIKVTDLQKTIKESKGPLIVNFWATFCVPCIQEIPYFQEMTEKYKTKGVSLLLVSLDLKEAYPSKIISTAGKLNFTAPIVWLNETNADYFCPKIDTSWTGGMPSSLFVNNATGYHKFFEDQLSRERLEKEIQAMLLPQKLIKN
jgi:thiol-disulfide isomerase/thioredoxin